MIRRAARCLVVAALLPGCEAKDNSSADPRDNVSLSGTLVSGSAVEGVRAGVRAGQQEGVRAGQTGGVRASSPRRADRPDAGQPLPGYALYCVTFEDTPRAGKGEADSQGSFKFAIAAAEVPFGCFVLDPNGTRVADLIFGHGENQALTAAARLKSDAHLGTVVVDSAAFAAFADLSGAKSLESSTSSHAPSDPNDDPTGAWNIMECQYWDGALLKTCDPVRKMFVGDRFYVNMVRARDLATGRRRYFLGVWTSESAFVQCGRTEGMSTAVQAGFSVAIEDPQSPAVGTFTFLPDPPQEGNWDDLLGPCKGIDLSGQPATCKDMASPAEAAVCYAACFQIHAAVPPEACIEDRSYDYAYLHKFLADPGGRAFAYTARPEAPGFVLPRGTPLARRSFLEVTYSSPLAMSGADVYSFTEGIPEAGTQTIRTCTSTMTMSASAVLDPNTGIATEDLVFNFGIAPEGSDFAWCAEHKEKLAFQGLYGTQHLRVKRKRP